MGKHDDEFEIIDQRQEKHATGGRMALKLPPGLTMFDNKRAGTRRVDFLPFKVTDNHLKYSKQYQFSAPGGWYFERTYFVHGGIGVDNGIFTCAQKTMGARCPICDIRQKLASRTDKESSEKAYGLKPKERQLFLLIERNDRTGEFDGDIKLWDESNWSFGKQLDAYIDGADYEDRAAYRKFYHPVKGFTIKLNGTKEKTGDGGGEYTKWSVHEFKSRKESMPDDLVRHGYDLDDMVRVMEYDDLKKIFLGVDEEAQDADAGRESVRVEAAPPGRRTQRNGSAPAENPADAPAERQERRPAPPPDDDAPPPRTRQARTPREEQPASPPPPPAREEPKKASVFATGDLVRVNYKGEPIEAKIAWVSIEDKLAKVPVPGKDRPITVDFDELTLLKSDDTFDAKPPAREEKKPAGKPNRWDDDDDGKSFQRK